MKKLNNIYVFQAMVTMSSASFVMGASETGNLEMTHGKNMPNGFLGKR